MEILVLAVCIAFYLWLLCRPNVTRTPTPDHNYSPRCECYQCRVKTGGRPRSDSHLGATEDC